MLIVGSFILLAFLSSKFLAHDSIWIAQIVVSQMRLMEVPQLCMVLGVGKSEQVGIPDVGTEFRSYPVKVSQ